MTNSDTQSDDGDRLLSRRFHIGLLIYVGGFFALRTLVSSTIGVDDVEQMIYAQDWRLGYNPSQPPLYTWLTLAAMEITGVRPIAPQVVRYLILLATFLFLYRCAGRLIVNPRLALLAAASPVLIYFIGWGAHQGFTHSALVGAASAATLWALLRVIENPSIANHLWLGLAFAVGLQSKYNFGMLAAAMLLAAAMSAPLRARLRPARLVLSVFVGLLALAPTLIWLLREYDLQQVLGAYVNYRPGEATVENAGRLPSLWSIVDASLSFAASFLVFAVIMFPQALRRAVPKPQPSAVDLNGQVLAGFFVIIYALLFAGALIGVLESVKIRWMYPILILLPLYYFVRVERAGYRATQLRRWQWLLFAWVGLTVVLWVLQPVARNVLCGRCRLFEPYPTLLAAIARDAGANVGTILAADEHIAGNIRPAIPGARVVTPIYPFYVPALPAAPCLLVWNARDGDTVPGRLAAFAAANVRYDGGAGRADGFVAGENRANGRPLRLGYRRVETCAPR